MSPVCKCSAFIATSLDGFIARSDGSLDWLSVVERPGEDYGFEAFYSTVDTVVLGRKTYETALGFDSWPYQGKRCIVLTRDTARVALRGEEFIAGEFTQVLEYLSKTGARHAYVDGGATIALALRAEAIAGLTISVIPVLLGSGVPLCPDIGRDISLELTAQRAYPSGLVQLCYRPQYRGAR